MTLNEARTRALHIDPQLRHADWKLKDSYLLDFLDLPERHDEADLQRGLVAKWREATPAQPTGGAAVVPVYAENGYKMTSDGAGSVTAAAGNPSAATPSRPETIVVNGVYWVAGNERAFLNVSAGGTAVYVSGSPLKRHLWVDRQGQISQLPGDADAINLILADPEARPTRLDVIVNWFPELARLVKK